MNDTSRHETTEHCSTCRFWLLQACHRMPPHLVPEQVQGGLGRPLVVPASAVWVPTSPDDWCGEWAGGSNT